MAEFHCPHCATTLSKKSYDAHRRIYYDEDASSWIKKRRLTTDEEHILLSETEHAIEQFDFDANFDSDSSAHRNNNFQHNQPELRLDQPPPHFDFDEMDEVGDTAGDMHAGDTTAISDS